MRITEAAELAGLDPDFTPLDVALDNPGLMFNLAYTVEELEDDERED